MRNYQPGETVRVRHTIFDQYGETIFASDELVRVLALAGPNATVANRERTATVPLSALRADYTPSLFPALATPVTASLFD